MLAKVPGFTLRFFQLKLLKWQEMGKALVCNPGELLLMTVDRADPDGPSVSFGLRCLHLFIARWVEHTVAIHSPTPGFSSW